MLISSSAFNLRQKHNGQLTTDNGQPLDNNADALGALVAAHLLDAPQATAAKTSALQI
jgi:hypothetical protein